METDLQSADGTPRELGGFEDEIEIDESFDDLPSSIASAFDGMLP